MEYRKFGNTDLLTSTIGFGTWELGGGYGDIVEDEAVAAIHRAIDLGVTLFDTAPAYGNGHSEQVLGQAVAGRRQDVLIVTKAGIGWDAEGKYVFNGTREATTKGVEGSLERLGTDYIDLLVIHRPDVNAPMLEIAEGLQAVREAGKARYVGVSNFTIEQLQGAMPAGTLAADQIGYNLFDRRAAETIEFCRSNGIGVMTYGSLCFGLLTGTMTEDFIKEGGRDWRKGGFSFGQALFQDGNFQKNLEVVDRLRAIAGRHGKSLPQLAVNWVLGNPGVSVALTGCRKPSEIEDNVGAVGWELSADDKREIEDIMSGAAGLTDAPWP